MQRDPAFSGNGQYTNRPDQEGVPNHGPIPAGKYFIVEPYHYTRFNGSVFFKLWRDDGKIDDETTLPNGQTRGQFRFHPGMASDGCVTVSKKYSAEWYRIQNKLLGTKTSTIPGTDITYYGIHRQMSRLYWLAWILGALAFWLVIGWFAVGALVIDPYYDRQVDKVVASGAPGAPSKGQLAPIERERGSVFKAVGVFGGVLCGFAFGVAGQRFRKSPSKTD